MDCSQLTRHLAGFRDRHIHTLDEDGRPSRLSFPAFAQQVQALQARLVEAGIGRGDRVGVHAGNCVPWLVWDLALVTLGAIVVALPEDIVRQHGENVFETFGLRLVALGQTGQSHRLAQTPGTVPIDEWQTAPLVARECRTTADLGASACALAFSSGTAGVPKCLVVNRHGIEWDTVRYFPQFDPAPDDRMLLFLPLTHQQQRLLAYAAYWLGTSIVLASPEQLFDALRLLRPSLCLAPPLFYEGIHERFESRLDAAAPWQRKLVSGARALLPKLPPFCAKPLRRLVFLPVHRALGARLRIAVTGMAPIRRSTLDFFAEIGVPLYEAYGLTETGVIASNVPGANRPGSVGRLVPGCRVSIAADGEILVARKAFACVGYFGPQGGVAAFDSEALLPTGDIGTLDADGYLFLTGRKKEIIVTAQGHKIHPEVVEARINAAPGVARSVVFGDARKHLSAVVVVRGEANDATRAAVEAQIARVNLTLGDTAKIGEIVVTAEAFTLTNGLLNGSLKVNRRAVAERFFPAWFAAAPDASATDATATAGTPRRPAVDAGPAPDAQLLALVKEAWERALGIEDIDVHADFFELGGDSLCAMRIIARLQGKIATAIEPSTLFLEPTIHAIASKLTRERLEAAQTRTPDAVNAYEEGTL